MSGLTTGINQFPQDSGMHLTGSHGHVWGGFKCDLPQQWGDFIPPVPAPKFRAWRDVEKDITIENCDTHTQNYQKCPNSILCLQNNTTYYSVKKKKNQNWYLFSYMGLRYLSLKKDYQECTQNLSILNILINKGCLLTQLQ